MHRAGLRAAPVQRTLAPEMNRLAALLITLVLWIPGSARSEICDVELVLALDVSASVDWREYHLQTGGLAAAFRSPEIAQIIEFWGDTGIYVTVVQWAGADQQQQIVPWSRLDDAAAREKLAAQIEAAPRFYVPYFTAIGAALKFSANLFDSSGVTCRHRVIDVSGDGASNDGAEPAPVRDVLVAAGITINGLIITGDSTGLETYYRQNVIGGNGAFHEIANGFSDFPRVIKRKLLKELSPVVSSVR